MWRAPERIGLGERLVECFDGTRDDAVFAAATILEALDVDPDLPSVLVSRARPMAAFAHIARRMLASLARQRPGVAEAADAWRPSTVPALRSLDELLGDLHGAESRREAERTLRDRFSREPGLAAELEGRYRASLRSRKKSDVSAALHDLSRLARAGVYLALVDEVSACAGGTGKSIETAREVLRWLAEAAPSLAPSDAIAILLDPSASPTSYAFHHALASVEHAELDLEEYAALADSPHGDDGYVRALRGLFRREAIVPGLLERAVERDVERHGSLTWPTHDLLLRWGPRIDAAFALPPLRAEATDLSPGHASGPWLLWGPKLTKAEIAIRAMGRASQHERGQPFQEALRALLGENKAIATLAASALMQSALIREDANEIASILGHRQSWIREAGLFIVECGTRSREDELRTPHARLDVPLDAIHPVLADRTTGIAMTAVRILRNAGVTLASEERPKLPTAKTIADLRSGVFEKVRIAQIWLSIWADVGYSAEELSPMLDALNDSVHAGVDRSVVDLAERIDLSRCIPALTGAFFGNNDFGALAVLAVLGRTRDTAIADPWIFGLLESTRPPDPWVSLRYVAARREFGVCRPLPLILWNDDSWAPFAVHSYRPEASR